jgi:hypothetical protein
MKVLGGSVACMAVVLLAGCGPKIASFDRHAVQPVEGQVIWQGQPLAGALVTFHPKGWRTDPGTSAPSAETGPDGRYQLTTYKTGDGAPAGNYAITVVLRKPRASRSGSMFGPNQLPKQYESPETSGLEVEIVSGANTVPVLDLGGKPVGTGDAKG